MEYFFLLGPIVSFLFLQEGRYGWSRPDDECIKTNKTKTVSFFATDADSINHGSFVERRRARQRTVRTILYIYTTSLASCPFCQTTTKTPDPNISKPLVPPDVLQVLGA